MLKVFANFNPGSIHFVKLSHHLFERLTTEGELLAFIGCNVRLGIHDAKSLGRFIIDAACIGFERYTRVVCCIKHYLAFLHKHFYRVGIVISLDVECCADIFDKSTLCFDYEDLFIVVVDVEVRLADQFG